MSFKSGKRYDVAIVGGGLAGLTAALTLAKCRTGGPINIALIAPVSPVTDGRTTALLGQSVTHLKQLGVWDDCIINAAQLSTMRILDGTRRLWRAPPVDFKALELGLEAFGYNIANSELANILCRHIEDEKSVTLIEEKVVSAEPGDDHASLCLDNSGRIEAKLVIAADGKNSRMRKAAGISVHSWRYPQSAIAVNIAHTVHHNFTSTEFHTEDGPFTIVPMPDIAGLDNSGKYQSGLVWVMRPEKIGDILALAPELLARKIEQKMQSILGRVSLAGTPQGFPLSGMVAHRFAAKRTVLVGDAAHLFPPIGAQGFNLGLRDVAEICSLASDALARGSDPGSNAVLNKFNRNRRLDVTSRTGAVDLLNRSLLTDFLPIQALRGLGLYTLSHIPFLRKLMMKQGLAPGMKFPKSAA